MSDYTNYLCKSNLIEISQTHDSIMREWREVSLRIRIICEGLQKALKDIKNDTRRKRFIVERPLCKAIL